MLHPSDGALETRVHATGNINTAFLSGGAKSPLWELWKEECREQCTHILSTSNWTLMWQVSSEVEA